MTEGPCEGSASNGTVPVSTAALLLPHPGKEGDKAVDNDGREVEGAFERLQSRKKENEA